MVKESTFLQIFNILESLRITPFMGRVSWGCLRLIRYSLGLWKMERWRMGTWLGQLRTQRIQRKHWDLNTRGGLRMVSLRTKRASWYQSVGNTKVILRTVWSRVWADFNFKTSTSTSVFTSKTARKGSAHYTIRHRLEWMGRLFRSWANWIVIFPTRGSLIKTCRTGRGRSRKMGSWLKLIMRRESG